MGKMHKLEISLENLVSWLFKHDIFDVLVRHIAVRSVCFSLNPSLFSSSTYVQLFKDSLILSKNVFYTFLNGRI